MTTPDPTKRRQAIGFDLEIHAGISQFAKHHGLSFSGAANVLIRRGLRMTERIDQHDAAFTPAPAPAPPAKLWTREALREMTKETLAQMVRAHPAFVYSKTPPIRWRHQELVDTLIQMQAVEIGRLSA